MKAMEGRRGKMKKRRKGIMEGRKEGRKKGNKEIKHEGRVGTDGRKGRMNRTRKEGAKINF